MAITTVAFLRSLEMSKLAGHRWTQLWPKERIPEYIEEVERETRRMETMDKTGQIYEPRFVFENCNINGHIVSWEINPPGDINLSLATNDGKVSVYCFVSMYGDIKISHDKKRKKRKRWHNIEKDFQLKVKSVDRDTMTLLWSIVSSLPLKRDVDYLEIDSENDLYDYVTDLAFRRCYNISTFADRKWTELWEKDVLPERLTDIEDDELSFVGWCDKEGLHISWDINNDGEMFFFVNQVDEVSTLYVTLSCYGDVALSLDTCNSDIQLWWSPELYAPMFHGLLPVKTEHMKILWDVISIMPCYEQGQTIIQIPLS